MPRSKAQEKKEAARIAELEKMAAGQTQDPATGDTQETATPTPTQTIDTPDGGTVEVLRVDDPLTQEVNNPPRPQTTQEPQPQTTQEPQTDTSDPAVWEQRYKTLQGKYDSEIEAVIAQNKVLQQQVALLQQQMAKPPEQPAPEETPQLQKYVTEQDIHDFEQEGIDTIKRAAREVVEEAILPLVTRLNELGKQYDNTGTQVREIGFTQRLLQLVPDFTTIDNDPAWHHWLNETDPMVLGPNGQPQPRKMVALAAYEAENAEQVAAYVNLFKATLSANNPESGQQTQTTRQAELERQATPAGSPNPAAATAQGQPQAVTYTRSDWARQAERVRVLNSQGKYDEATKLENELSAAQLEGRVMH